MTAPWHSRPTVFLRAAGLGLLAWTAQTGAARADACGQALANPEIDIRSEFAPPDLDHNRNLRALIADPAFAAARSEDFPYMLGVTQMSVSGNLSMSIKGVPRSDGTFCWSVQRLDITLQAVSTVYIASEIQRDGCLWREVWHHEERHVAANRQYFPQFAALIRPDVLEVARRTLAAATDAEAEAFFAAAINRAAEKAQHRFEASAHDRHRKIDTPEEYSRVSNTCGDGEMREVLTRAGLA